MSEFTVYPAIDLRGGRVVRLKQGRPDQQTIYGNDPGQVAASWTAAGAKWLHVVDLDGAFGDSSRENLRALGKIVEVCGQSVQIQFGGGLRDAEAIEGALKAGVARAVVGTAAIEDQRFAELIVGQFGPKRVAFALDARNGRLATRGWQAYSNHSLDGFAGFLSRCGAKYLIYTNIRRDGMGTGVDWQGAKQIAKRTGLQVIASGGVARLEDVKMIKRAGLNGVIIGRALYENQLSLAEVLAC